MHVLQGRGRLLLVAASALALFLGLGHGLATTTEAGAEPGMSLAGEGIVCDATGCFALPGQSFVVRVFADPAPTDDMSGWQTELILNGLEYTARAACTDEVLTTYQDAPLPVCTRAEGPNGEPRHVAGPAAVQVPPLPALDAPLDLLLEVDLACPADVEATHNIILTAAAAQGGSSYGAAYYDLFTIPVFVPSTPISGTLAADTLLINCTEDAPQFTPTPTNTVAEEPAEPTATPLATVIVVETGFGSSGSGGDGPGGPWIAIGALLAVAASGLSLLGWRYARHRA